MEIDSALTAIQTLRSELQDAMLAAVNAQLKPLPGESVRSVVCFNTEIAHTDYLQLIALRTVLRVCSLIFFTFIYKTAIFFCFSWRSVLRIWAAPLSQWGPPWLSCSPVPHKEMSTTQVSTADILTSLKPLRRIKSNVIASIPSVHPLFSFQINISPESLVIIF